MRGVLICLYKLFVIISRRSSKRSTVQGHFYVMTQYMKGPETTVLNSVFVHKCILLFDDDNFGTL